MDSSTVTETDCSENQLPVLKLNNSAATVNNSFNKNKNITSTNTSFSVNNSSRSINNNNKCRVMGVENTW